MTSFCEEPMGATVFISIKDAYAPEHGRSESNIEFVIAAERSADDNYIKHPCKPFAGIEQHFQTPLKHQIARGIMDVPEGGNVTEADTEAGSELDMVFAHREATFYGYAPIKEFPAFSEVFDLYVIEIKGYPHYGHFRHWNIQKDTAGQARVGAYRPAGAVTRGDAYRHTVYKSQFNTEFGFCPSRVIRQSICCLGPDAGRKTHEQKSKDVPTHYVSRCVSPEAGFG